MPDNLDFLSLDDDAPATLGTVVTPMRKPTVSAPAAPVVVAEPTTEKKRPLIAEIIELNDEKKQVERLLKLFPGKDGAFKRLLTYSYLYGVAAYDDPTLDPKYFPVNLIGEPGYGKSATTYEWANVLGMEMVVRTLAGVSDFESILGIVNTNKETGRSELYVPETMPLQDEHDRYGVVFLDDYNRGEGHCIGAAMLFANTGRHNDYRLPKHFGIVAASNPQGAGHRVKSIDNAQYTRFCNVVMKGDPEIFQEQLMLQGAPGIIQAYHAKFKDMLHPEDSYQLPDPRPLNFRNRMGHAALCRWAQHDKSVLHMISYAIYGAHFSSQLENLQTGEFPLEIPEIVDADFATVEKRVKGFIDGRRDDLLTISTNLLVRHLNKQDTNMSKPQMENIYRYFMQIPEGIAMMGLRRLVLDSCPRGKHYAPLFLMWESPDGKTVGPLARLFVERQAQMKREIEHYRNLQAQVSDPKAA